MSKYNVRLPYKLFIVKEVEAENEKEAINKDLGRWLLWERKET